MKRGVFLKTIFVLATILLCIVFLYPIISYLLYREQKILRVSFHPNERLGKVNFKKGVYLIKSNHNWYALSAHCTHLGCIVNFDEKTEKFHCPCHGSIFDISGKRVAGPANRPLTRLPLRFMKNGDIIVIKRD